MCRGRRARILLHLHVQREKLVPRGSRTGRRFELLLIPELLARKAQGAVHVEVVSQPVPVRLPIPPAPPSHNPTPARSLLKRMSPPPLSVGGGSGADSALDIQLLILECVALSQGSLGFGTRSPSLADGKDSHIRCSTAALCAPETSRDGEEPLRRRSLSVSAT